MNPLNELEFGIGSLTNSEIYHLISDVLECGGLGSQLIEKEKLLINFKLIPEDSFVKEMSFILFSTLPIISKSQTEPTTSISIGRIDLLNDEFIILNSEQELASIISADDLNFENQLINQLIVRGRNNCEGLSFNPFSISTGISTLTASINETNRELNHLFKLNRNSPSIIGKIITHEIHLNDYPSFNGEYYEIVSPIGYGKFKILEIKIEDNEDSLEFENVYIQKNIEVIEHVKGEFY